MNRIEKSALAVSMLFATFGATAGHADTIANPVNNYAFPALSGALVGGQQTQRIGQTFTSPITGSLTNFEFTLTSSSLQALMGSVYAWDVAAIRPVSQALWTSGTVANPSGLLDFNPTGVTLTAGTTYVAFLDTFGLANNSGVANVASCLALGTCNSNAIPNLGTLVYGNVYPDQNTGQFNNDPANISYSNAFNVVYDATFSATIQAAAVPEPASWAMMISGFGLIGGTLRRRNKIAATVKFA
jgi:hypothetical protein